MKLVTCMGELFRLSERQYTAALRHRSRGMSVDLSLYGRSIGVINLDFTDLDPEQAAFVLDAASAPVAR